LAAGGLIGLATAVRPVGLFLIAPLALWLALDPATPGVRTRLGRLGIVLAGLAVVVVPYMAIHASVTDHWSITRAQGATLYARAATFADCSKFTPPAATAALCEDNDPDERPAAVYYMFDPSVSPMIKKFGWPPIPNPGSTPDDYEWGHDEKLGEFARAAVLGQPLDYLETLGYGFANYFTPSRVGPKSTYDWDSPALVRQIRASTYENSAAKFFPGRYTTPAGYLKHNAELLDDYGDAMRLEGIPSALLLAVALAGLILGRRLRYSELLFLGLALTLMLASVATLYYDARYATPAYGFLAAAAALGLGALLERRRPAAPEPAPS
jgi:hypothetical protein